MSADNYTFTISVSQQCYPTKPERYQIAQLLFEPRQLTIDGVLQCAKEGRAFCSSFSSDREDGIITTSTKCEENFLSTSTVFFDFDEMCIDMDSFIACLKWKPTFAYPTYSNGKDGFYCFRLCYVLTEEITSLEEFKSLYGAIAQANGFVKREKGKHGGLDNLNVVQLYLGTTSTASTFKSEIFYTKAAYERYIVNSIGHNPQTPILRKEESHKCNSPINAEFLHDFRRLKFVEFYMKYKDKFFQNYISSLSTKLILDKSGMFYTFPDDYVCVCYKRNGKDMLRWKHGDRRKKKLFITAQIMLYNLPNMSLENLLYNLRLELQWHYDNSDRKISYEYLIEMAIGAFNKPFPLDPSKHGKFKLNKPYWEGKGFTANQAKMIVRNELKAREIRPFINPYLSIPENCRILNEQSVEISLRTLERMVSRGDIKIVPPTHTHTYLSCCRDSVTIQILKMIERNGRITQHQISDALNCCLRTVKRYLKDMSGVYIFREGNNRTGQWGILPRGRQVMINNDNKYSESNQIEIGIINPVKNNEVKPNRRKGKAIRTERLVLVCLCNREVCTDSRQSAVIPHLDMVAA